MSAATTQPTIPTWSQLVTLTDVTTGVTTDAATDVTTVAQYDSLNESVAAIGAWWASLFTGRIPEGLKGLLGWAVRYQAQLYSDDGQRVTRTFDTQRQAEDWLIRMKARRLAGDAGARPRRLVLRGGRRGEQRESIRWSRCAAFS